MDKLNFIVAQNAPTTSGPNGEQNVECTNILNINLPTGMSIDQVVNILKQLPLQNVQMTNRCETIVKDGIAEGGSPADEVIPEIEVESKEVTDVISSLEDQTEQKMTEVTNQRVWTDNEDKVHVAFDLKVTSWTVMQPLCRLNTVILLIALFSSIATAIFVVFLYFIGSGVSTTATTH